MSTDGDLPPVDPDEIPPPPNGDAGRLIDLPIEDELKESYLTYAMSVIVSRALPDVRDGLKPSQRRILVAMNDLEPDARRRPREVREDLAATRAATITRTARA